MHFIITGRNGKRLEALVLAVGENRLRAVLAGHNDVVELCRQYGQWSSDLGEVEVEAMFADGRIDLKRFLSDFCPAERAAAFEYCMLTDGAI